MTSQIFRHDGTEITEESLTVPEAMDLLRNAYHDYRAVAKERDYLRKLLLAQAGRTAEEIETLLRWVSP